MRHEPSITLHVGASTLREAERKLIKPTVKRYRGNMTAAAEVLGVSRPTLYDRMKKHGITVRRS